MALEALGFPKWCRGKWSAEAQQFALNWFHEADWMAAADAHLRAKADASTADPEKVGIEKPVNWAIWQVGEARRHGGDYGVPREVAARRALAHQVDLSPAARSLWQALTGAVGQTCETTYIHLTRFSVRAELTAGALTITVDNRFSFTHLNELTPELTSLLPDAPALCFRLADLDEPHYRRLAGKEKTRGRKPAPDRPGEAGGTGRPGGGGRNAASDVDARAREAEDRIRRRFLSGGDV